MSATYRYPGVKPFEAADSALFFGRDRDRADLLDLICREQLVLMFGKSGYGKSSLLKAGLMPDLIAKPYIKVDAETGEEYTVHNWPVYVRFNLYGKSKQSVMPCEKVLNLLNEQSGTDSLNATLSSFFDEKKMGNTLWMAFKCNDKVQKHRVFLIFDQFEEFFSYPLDAQTQFRQQLSELLYTRIPQAVRDQMGDLDRSIKSALHKPMEVHTLFSIRSDRMHLLNSLREELPAILQTRYELKALSAPQAEAAITRPAQLDGTGFLLKKPFAYEPAALNKIIYELSKANKNDAEMEMQSQIEAFQLQMVCQTIEQTLINQTVKAKGIQPEIVKEADLPDFELIYEQYYEGKLADLADARSRETAHRLLEEEMVIGDDLAELRRISVDKDLLRETMNSNHQMALTQEIMDYLEDKFLIRRETIGGRVHYEVSHDVLLAPLFKSRSMARQAAAERTAREQLREQQAAAEKRAADAEERALVEREGRLAAIKSRRKARILAVAAILGLLLSLGLGIWAYRQKMSAEVAWQKAVKAEEDAINQRNAANAALRLVIETRKERLVNQIKMDREALFIRSAQAKELLLAKVETMEKDSLPPSEILTELEK